MFLVRCMVPVVAVLLIGGSCGDDGDAADGGASTTTSVDVTESEVESPIMTSTTEATTPAEPARSPVEAGEGSAERVEFDVVLADARFVGAAAQVAVGDDGVVWVYLTGNRRPGIDPPSIVRGDGGQWVKVATEDDIPADFTAFRPAPTFVGVDADGSLWLTEDAWGAPSGPYVLWQFDGETWTDHSAASGLPGSAGTDANMSCCAVAIDPGGTVWAENPPVSRFFDGTSWVDSDPGEGAYQVLASERQTYPGDDAGRLSLCRRFHAQHAPDGSLWYTAPCHSGSTLGDFIEFEALMRVGPDETTTVYDARSFVLPTVILDFDIGPDGTVWVAGDGGLSRLVPG